MGRLLNEYDGLQLNSRRTPATDAPTSLALGAGPTHPGLNHDRILKQSNDLSVGRSIGRPVLLKAEERVSCCWKPRRRQFWIPPSTPDELVYRPNSWRGYITTPRACRLGFH